VVEAIVKTISVLTSLIFSIVSLLTDIAERIAVRGEMLLLLLFNWPHRMREMILIDMVQRYWPRWLTANMLTGSRVLIGAVITSILLLNDAELNSGLIATLFSLGLVTEILDGSVARAMPGMRPASTKLEEIISQRPSGSGIGFSSNSVHDATSSTAAAHGNLRRRARRMAMDIRETGSRL